MTENQNTQTGSKNQNDNQSNDGQKNPGKEGNSSERTALTEDNAIKPSAAEDSKEQEPRMHPHEVSVPVAAKEDKSSL